MRFVKLHPKIIWNCKILLRNHPGLQQKPDFQTHSSIGYYNQYFQESFSSEKVSEFPHKSAKCHPKFLELLPKSDPTLFWNLCFLKTASIAHPEITERNPLGTPRCQAQQPEGTQHREDPNLPGVWG